MWNNILAFHFGHHGAVTYVRNNEVIFHTQLDRYYKIKNYGTISKQILNIVNSLEFDTVLVTDIDGIELPEYFDSLCSSDSIFRNKISKCKIFSCSDKHHIFHAYSMHLWSNDNLKKIFVIDGNGVQLKNKKTEQESLYTFENNKCFHNFTSHEKLGYMYQSRSEQIFKTFFSEGKLMAMSNYGLTKKKYYNKDQVEVNNENEKFDYARSTQKFCEDKVIELFKKNITDISTSVFLTGGVAQNVLLNTKLKKIFPNYISDPICTDSGISLGAINYCVQGNLKKLNHPYLGIKQNLDFSLYNINIKTTSLSEVTTILQKDPIAIFQSRSEQGQRGLGNRSLLMNPQASDCFKKINEIKKREWFRPFALTILDEYGDEWFENYFTSKWMKYVFVLKREKRGILKSGYARDFTSRIQSLKKEDNVHYYNLLESFYKLTKCPCVINTSLNLPGEVLVETVDDLVYMLKNSKLKYAYLPEIQKLIYYDN